MEMSIYPQDKIPTPDARGRIVFEKSPSKVIFGFFVAFIMIIFAAFSCFYWYEYMISGSLFYLINNQAAFVLALGGIAAIPLAPITFIGAIFPPTLEISSSGVKYRQNGKIKELGWNDIEEIRLNEISINKYGGTKLITIVLGRDLIMKWAPVFEISPKTLVDYLKFRKQESS